MVRRAERPEKVVAEIAWGLKRLPKIYRNLSGFTPFGEAHVPRLGTTLAAVFNNPRKRSDLNGECYGRGRRHIARVGVSTPGGLGFATRAPDAA